MYSAVSGLSAHITKMNVIGNNISNVNTYGFKSSRVTFSDVFYQTISGASEPSTDASGSGGTNPTQLGYGAKVNSIDVINTRAGSATTDRAMDVYINGEGYLAVQDADGSFKYTRVGILGFDKLGNMVDSNGNKVLGLPLDKVTGKALLNPDGTLDSAKFVPINIPAAELDKYSGITIGQTGEITGIAQGDPVLSPASNTGWLTSNKISATSLYSGSVTMKADVTKVAYTPNAGITGVSIDQGANILGNVSIDYDKIAGTYMLNGKDLDGNPIAVPGQVDAAGNIKFYVDGLVNNSNTVAGVAGTPFVAGTPGVQGATSFTISTALAAGDILTVGGKTITCYADAAALTTAGNADGIIVDTADNQALAIKNLTFGAGVTAAVTANKVTLTQTTAGTGIVTQADITGVTFGGTVGTITFTAGVTNVPDTPATLGVKGTTTFELPNSLPAGETIIVGGRTIKSYANVLARSTGNGGLVDTNGIIATDTAVAQATAIRTMFAADPNLKATGTGNTVTLTQTTAGTGAVLAAASGSAVSIDKLNYTTTGNYELGSVAATEAQITVSTYLKSGLPTTLPTATWSAASLKPLTLGDIELNISKASFEKVGNIADGTLLGRVGTGAGVPTKIASLAAVKFTNSDGLSQSGEGYYVETSNSGSPVGTIPGSQGVGTFRSGALEMSNVDLSREFTEMIITQRGFQANTRMITVSDEMLSELVSMKR